MNAPCKDCPDRQVLCHASCEKYLAYRAERDRRRMDHLADSGTVWGNENRAKATRKKLNRYKRDH